MAGSSKSKSGTSSPFSKLFDWLNGFLKSMPSPMSGWDMSDVKVKQDGDNFSSYFQFKSVPGELKDSRTGEAITDVSGNAIQLDVLLKIVNSQTVLSPIMSGLNTMNQNDIEGGKDLLEVLFGPSTSSNDQSNDSSNEQDTEQSDADTSGDQSSDTQDTDDQSNPQPATGSTAIMGATDFIGNAKAKGTGLLGVDLSKVGNTKDLPDDGYTYGGKEWSWATLAFDYLKYSLECQIPGKDYGAIENISLDKAPQLISEYLLHENIIGDASEVQVDTSVLVLPMLGRMQGMLAQYFDKAYKKNPGIQEVEDANDIREEPEHEPETVAVFDKDDPNTIAEYVDIATPEGQAHLDELLSQGYSIMESKRINITLKKIQGSTDFDVLALKSNYSPSETLDDLDDIISQDEFLLALPETAQSYTIDVDDDGYDIAACDSYEVPCGEGLGHIMQSGIKFYRNLYILHWMAKGNDMMKLHELSQTMYEELIEEIDTLGELMVEKCGTVISPSFGCDYLEIRNYEFQEGLDIIVNYIQEYLDMIDYAYPNQTSDVQSVFDEWIRYWNKQLNYFVKGQEA